MPIILYELIGRENDRYYSPNTFKTRLSLLHKGVAFETRAVTINQLRTDLAKRMGIKRPLVPTIELEDGSFIGDSWKIALWLEQTYPDTPSLFLPTSSVPVKPDSPEMQVAKSYADMMNRGLGDSEPGWSTFFELCAEDLAELFEPEDKAYFVSDAKNGPGGWAKVVSMDKEQCLARAKASLLPLEAILRTQDYLTGSSPGFVDYVVYGRYAMMVNARCQRTEEVWGSKEIHGWIERLEKRYGTALTDTVKK